MCLAIPARITSLSEDDKAQVDILGLTRDISVRLTPDAQIGDFVLVHAGFAITIVEEDEALNTLDLIKRFPELAEDEAEALTQL